MAIQLQIPQAFQELFLPARYKGFHGGRGGAKSWAFAQVLAVEAYRKPLRVLCVREFQNSIADSVHRLISDRIRDCGLSDYYEVTQTSIRGKNGSEFIFKGIKQSPQEVKSMEGIDRCWYEEAQRASKNSLDLLIPTIRKPGSELWFSWNPEDEDNPIENLLRSDRQPPNSIIRHVGWQDNPWFPKVLDDERRYLLSVDPVAYEHVWEGGYIKIGDSVIFKNRVSVESFTTPPRVRHFIGADWGFANDPTALVRAFIQDECLYVDYEAFGHNVEIDETDQLFDSVPDTRKWPIKADSSRPETISFMRRKGFNISPAEKWKGSVEDGIAHLKGFKQIIVHERCKHIAQEFRLYSYKTDKVTGEVLPVIVDKHNHGIDALRYSLDGYIQKRGGLGVWAKLAK